jgi:septal ring factor EnvC (AmiA/AmiB activator)
MAKPKLSPLQRQLAQVSRRLFWQTLLACLLWCWAGTLVLAAGWFLVQALFWPELAGSWRLVIAAGGLAAGTGLAVVLALIQAPPKLAAALLLDERFGLKERVTTSLTLTPDLEKTPAGIALLEDVNQRIQSLDVGSRFPVRVSWLTTAMPACAALIALAAFFYQPPLSQATIDKPDKEKQAPTNTAEIEKKLNQLKKRTTDRRPADRPASEELKRIDTELEQIANRPRKTQEQLKERIKEMTALEDTLKQRERELAERSRAVKQQLSRLDQMSDKEAKREGPAKDLEKALAEGKLDKVQEELERLTKKIKENELTKKEQEQLAKQLDDLQKKIENLAQQKDKQDQLKQLHKEGKIDAATLKRELAQLKEDSKKLKELQKLASKLGQCQQCLKKGDNKGAAQSMEEAGDNVKNMNLDDQDMEDLREQLQRLQDAKDSC